MRPLRHSETPTDMAGEPGFLRFLRLQFVNHLVSGDAGDDFLGCRQRLGGELPDTSVSHAMQV